MSCRTPLSPDEFISDAGDKAKEMIDRLSDIVLPDNVNDTLDATVERMKESMIAEGKAKKANEIDWTHFTYSTRENQFKLDHLANGKWVITSTWTYWSDPRRWNEMTVADKLAEAAKDVELLNHLIEHAEKDDLDKFLED